MVLWFKAKAANTGATTLNVNGLGVQPVVGGAHSALQGGEIIANGKCQMVWNATLSSWVLIECTGGALQVASGLVSGQAVNFGQFPFVNGSSGYQKMPGGRIIQWGVSGGTSTSIGVTFPVAFPNAISWVGFQDSGGQPSLSLWSWTAAALAGFTAYNIGSVTKGSSTVNASVVAGAPWYAIGY